jgi:hypothetical protein
MLQALPSAALSFIKTGILFLPRTRISISGIKMEKLCWALKTASKKKLAFSLDPYLA